MSKTSRFKVLATQKLTQLTTTYSTTSVAGFDVPFTLAWKGTMVVNFTAGGTTADIANVVDNSIHVVAFATSIDFVPKLVYSSRIRFVG